MDAGCGNTTAFCFLWRDGNGGVSFANRNITEYKCKNIREGDRVKGVGAKELGCRMELLEVLKNFQTPGKYLGTENNSYTPKDGDGGIKKFMLCFPDDYTIGMSSLGYHTVGNIVHNHSSFSCERCFSPGLDMENWMRKNNINLFSLETKAGAGSFDIMGFSIQYELSYTNLLNMLDLAGLKVFRCERSPDDPVIIGGGSCTVNPSLLGEFLDLIVIGEAEAVLPELLKIYPDCRNKEDFLKRGSALTGVYVPGISKHVKSAVFHPYDNTYYPVSPPVPLIDITHNRINIEISRGCPHRCRFCQATAIYSPYREKSPREILDIAVRSIASTGYDEIALTSLSAADHPHLIDIIDDLHYAFRDIGVTVVLPSIRAGICSEKLFNRLSKLSLRKGNLTFAPETPSEKLKKIIGKNIKNCDIIESAKIASKNKWKNIKLYFMVGLPEETMDDVREIPAFIKEVASESRLNINVSVSCMVPQPHTAFESRNNEDVDLIQEKINLVRSSPAKVKKFNIRQHIIESILKRGDSSIAKVVYYAWKNGARFDQWAEHFNFSIWEKAFNDCGTSWQEHYYTDYESMEKFPWDVVSLS